MITVNGEEEKITKEKLSEFLASKNYALDRIAVELNGDIVPKCDYPFVTLKDGDVLEIASFVGGG